MTGLFSIALAASTAEFPVVAPVQLPISGVSSIEVPPELRHRSDVHDGTDLLLVDANGREVPMAVRRSDNHQQWLWGSAGRGSGDLRYWPTVQRGTYEVQIGPQGIDGLQIRLEDEPRAATVRIYDGQTLLTEGDQWRVGSTYAEPLPLEAAGTVLRVEIDGTRTTDATFAAVRYPNGADGVSRRVPVEAPELTDQGWVRYQIPGARGLPVTSVVLRPERTLFERKAMARRTDPFDTSRLNLSSSQVVQRFDLGGRKVEDLDLEVGGQGPDLQVLVEGPGPLELPEVDLRLASVQLLVRDPGPGPHKLYGRAPAGSRRASDIQFAAGELARIAGDGVQPGEVGKNPEYVSPEVRSRVALPATELDPAGFTAQAAVTGPEGLVRIDLSPEIQSTARRDLGDLRLMDGDRRQIPYVTVDTDDVWDWGELPFERREEGQRSYLELNLPVGNIQLGAVELATEAEHFERTVEVAQVTGGRIDTLRAVQWRDVEWGGMLRVNVQEPVADKLVVVIDNGDNPPLPVSSIRASRAGRAVVAHLPADGATLLFGDPKRSAPDYDLASFRWELRDRDLEVATVGPIQERKPEPASMFDRGLVFAGVVVMALGLLGLTLVLLLPGKEPDEDPESPEPGDDDEQPPADGEPDDVQGPEDAESEEEPEAA